MSPRPRSLASRLPPTWREAFRLLAARLLDLRVRLSARRLALVLVYHRLGDQPGDPRFELVPAVGRELFDAELAHLARRYRVVAASDVIGAAAARRRGERFPVALTFDDDLVSHAALAAPALRAQGVPATFFLTGPPPGGRTRRWWESLQVAIDQRLVRPEQLQPIAASLVEASLAREPHATGVLAQALELLPPEELAALEAELERRTAAAAFEPALSSEQISELAREGFEVGFHTRDHRLFTTLDERAARAALVEGKRELEHEVGGSISLLAYPHGKAEPWVAEAAAEAGYKLAFTGRREPVRPETDRFLVGRFEPRADTPGRFALELARAIASA